MRKQFESSSFLFAGCGAGVSFGVASALSEPFAFWLVAALSFVFLRRPDGLLLTTFLWAFDASDFGATAGLSLDVGIQMLGVNVNVSLAVAGVAVLIGLLGFATSTSSQRRLSSFVYGAWFTAAVVSAYCAFIGLSSGGTNWTQGARLILFCGCLFAGVFQSFSPLELRSAATVLGVIAPIVVIVSAIGVLGNHAVFLALALCSGFATETILRGRFLVALPTAIAISMFLVLGNPTLTMLLLVVVPILVSFFAARGRGSQAISAGGGKKVALLGTLLALLLSTMPVIVGTQTGLVNSSVTDSLTLTERVRHKVLEDRGQLWAAAFEQAISGPLIIPPSGRTLIVSTATVAQQEWSLHCHNTFLELARQAGLVVLAAFILIWTWSLAKLWAAMQQMGPGSLRSVAVALISIHAVCPALGLVGLDFSAGIWTWAATGAIVGPLVRFGR